MDAANELLRRYKARMRYMTGRYASHAPYWQLVVWGRQLLLMLAATAAKGIVSTETGVQRAVVWLQAAIALLILLVFWRLQERVLPYEFAYQNWVESWLFGANVLLLLLAILYTALGHVAHLSKHGPARSAVEGVMVVVLVVTLVLSATVLVRAYRKGARRQAEARAALSDNLGAGALRTRRGTTALADQDAAAARKRNGGEGRSQAVEETGPKLTRGDAALACESVSV